MNTTPGETGPAAAYSGLDAVTAKVFRLLAVCTGPDITTTAASFLAGMPLSKARTALTHLAEAGLVEPGSGAGRWRLPEETRPYARQLADACSHQDNQGQAREFLVSYYAYYAVNADFQFFHGSQGKDAGIFGSQEEAFAWLDDERSNLLCACQLAADGGHHKIAVLLARALGAYLTLRHGHEDRQSLATIALSSARALDERADEGDALINLAHASQSLGRDNEALTAAGQAISAYREAREPAKETSAQAHLGAILGRMGRHSEAIAILTQAADLMHYRGDLAGEGQARGTIGNSYYATGEFAEALEAYKRATAIFKTAGTRREEAQTLNNAGLALRELNRSEEAIAHHHQAIAIYADLKMRPETGRIFNDLGLALASLLRYEDAIAAYRESTAILQAADMPGRAALASRNIGEAMHSLGRHSEAQTEFRKAAAGFHLAGDYCQETATLRKLGYETTN